MLLVTPVLEQHRLVLSEEQRRTLTAHPDLIERAAVPRSTIPAVTHVDYSARVQTVDDRHGRFHRLLQAFQRVTGCPVLVNTSFNLAWEPIVHTPEEAYHTFMQSEMDALVLEDYVILKPEQPLGLRPWASSGPQSESLEESPWADPVTGEPLVMSSRAAGNPATGASYPVEDGIPRLYVRDSPRTSEGDITDIVKQFYETTPFPNYDDVDNRRALVEKARAGTFARLLNEQIPYDARVLEVGCGTGQLTNFLAIAHRAVLGIDVCLNSFQLAQRFKTDQGLERASFAQMNLFRPGLKQSFFDVVISNGVLHHTSDCRAAFAAIGRLVTPGGHLIVGLYSAYSRKVHAVRRAVVRLTGVTSPWLDPQFDRLATSGKRDAWFQDQYHHPHETSHTLDEVLEWLQADGFTFVNFIPKPAPGVVLGSREQLFAPRCAGTAVGRMVSQVAHVSSGYREGGFFTVIARRGRETS